MGKCHLKNSFVFLNSGIVLTSYGDMTRKVTQNGTFVKTIYVYYYNVATRETYELFLGVEVLRLEKTGVANHNRYCCDCFSWYNSSFSYLLSFHKCKPGSNNDRVCDIKTELYCIYLC